MPDELYLWKPDDAAYQVSGVMKPAGFTMAQVTALAEWVERAHPHYLLGAKPSALAPFASLLKEKNDAA
jgi:hypothetical protein